ncbi:hypothetical protein [Sulfurimonas indica]|uniref:hypothetical protein n=1 Tax=Sulfurimonas TaxID=202746 RepID=UPI001264F931|nr:hypothetical protein [Sulfurimonas indica]
MKIQLTLDNPKAIAIYNLLEKKIKSKSFEKALFLLAQDSSNEIYFGYENAKKAKAVAMDVVITEALPETEPQQKTDKPDNEKTIDSQKSDNTDTGTKATSGFKIEL